MNCPNCGHGPLRPEVRFCPNCGNSLAVAPVLGEGQSTGVNVGGDFVGHGRIEVTQNVDSIVSVGGKVIGVQIGQIHGPVTIEPSHSSVPPPPRYFVGRKKELATAETRIVESDRAVIALLGPAGIGKTALALAMAKRLRAHYPDGEIFLDLRGSRLEPLSPNNVMEQVISNFSSAERPPQADSELLARYRAILEKRRMLLVLDDVEPRQIETLMPPQGCLLLFTSRAAQNLLPSILRRRSILFVVNGLPIEEGTQLLRQLAPGRFEQGAGLTTKIVKLLEGIPLALRLAGGLIVSRRDLVASKYADELAATGLGAVDAALDVTYHFMSEQDQPLSRALAIFPGTFDLRAAADVWHLSEREAGDLLARWQREGVVERDARTGRFDLHVLVQQFFESRLRGEERRQGQRGHAAHYLTVLDAAQKLHAQDAPDRRRGLELFDLEWLNIQVGQAWAAENSGTDADAARLCNAYAIAGLFGLESRRHPLDRKEWLEAALAAARRLQDRDAELAHLTNLSLAYADMGETAQAIRLSEAALDASLTLEDRAKRARALSNLAAALTTTGRVPEAIGRYEEALAIYRKIGDRQGENAVLGNLGVAYQALGDRARAIAYHSEALDISRQIGDRTGEGNALGNLGNAYAAMGDARQAVHQFEKALTLKREIGDRAGEGIALGNLGLAYLNLGEVRRAGDMLEQALSIARQVGDRRNEGNILNNMGAAYEALGARERANDYYAQYLEIARETGDRRGEANALGNLASGFIQSGDLTRATNYQQQALVIYREIGDRSGESKALRNLGAVHVARADFTGAIESYEASLAIVRQIGDRGSEETLLVELGAVHDKDGKAVQAVDCYESALGISQAIGDRAMQERLLGTLSRTYDAEGNFPKATDYYQQALTIAREKGDQTRTAEILLALGNLARKADQPDQAKRYWTESRDLYEKLNPDVAQSVRSSLTELEAAHRDLFSLPEIARSYLQAAGFQVSDGPDRTLFLCQPRDAAWQGYFNGASVATKVLSGKALDREMVIGLVDEIGQWMGKLPRWVVVIYDRAPTNGAWLQIGALRDDDVKVMPVGDTILLVGQQKARQRGELFDYLEDRYLGPQRDLYDRPNPISDPLSFFGREQLADQLINEMVAGNPVALFGLRKMGKSMLLNFLRDKMPCPVALVDLQLGTDLLGLYSRILDDWCQSLRVKVPDLVWTPPRLPKTRGLRDAFTRAASALLSQLEGHSAHCGLTLLVDEIELIAPQGRVGLSRYLDFAWAVRGLAQDFRGRFALMITGVDPSIIRTNRFAGQQNPFYSFFKEKYLPPLHPDDCKQMIRNIGVQIGLAFSDAAVDYVAEISGGHPYWARRLCSLALQGWDGSGEITETLVRSVAQNFVRDPNTSALLDDHGLWGEVTDPSLWPRSQITANESILLSLAQTRRRQRAALTKTGPQRSAYDASLYELNQRSVLEQAQPEWFGIHLLLFRDWIRRDKLGEESDIHE